MHPLATNREQLLRLAAVTLEQIESGQFREALAAASTLESAEAAGPEPEVVANALSAALDWARLEENVIQASGTLESVTPDSADVPYIPSNQVLSLLQSAYDEHLEEREAAAVEEPFDNFDPGWITVAWEKLKALLRGKRTFIRHANAESFRYSLPTDAVVALFADWGTGEETAQRVMEQIRKVNPTHAIHLGDVYYSGTPKEIEKRFLSVIQEHGPSRDTCRYLALNSNHEMYSGGYGYFDTTLPKFGQDASYFNLGNGDWQLIGLDSGYEDHGLKDPQKEWLAEQVKRPGRSILLSHHQVFSPYERRAADRKLAEKVKDLLPKVYAWFWGHEHKCIIFGDHLGIKARCIGHGAIPSRVPYGEPESASVPILRVDERLAPGGGGIHGFAVLRFAGKRLDVQYIDEFGDEFFAERLDVQSPVSMFVPAVHTEGAREQPAGVDVAAHYKRLLKRREALLGFESVAAVEDASGEPDLSRPAIDDRVESTRAALHRIVKEHLGDRLDLHEIADQIANDGRESLDALTREGPVALVVNDEFTAGLEVIVRTDGSRPSFMVRNGDVDVTTSPVGTWGQTLTDSAEPLRAAMSCVGRINLPGSSQGFAGTGFLIQENLIMTNRHVLQAIARSSTTGAWTFQPGVTIDFGHEFRARTSVSPRAVKRVVFSPSRIIASPIDHTKLDLVLMELEPASKRPETVLALDIAPDWANTGQIIYTVGYPGNPGLGESLSLLEQLFQSTFGCKRLAPGEIQLARSAVHTWTLAHDASTLGGNSGSAVLVAGREGLAAGLHYGGTRADPRENWGHVVGLAMSEADKATGRTLRDCLSEFGVELIDRSSS